MDESAARLHSVLGNSARRSSYWAAPFCFVTRQREHLADPIVWLPVERGYSSRELLGHGCNLLMTAGSRFVLRLKVLLPIL